MFHRDFYPILIEVACGLAVALTMSYAVYDDVKRGKEEARVAKEAATIDLTMEKKEAKDLEAVTDDGEEDDNDGDSERDSEHNSDDSSNRMDDDSGADTSDDDSSLRTLSEREEGSEEVEEEPEQEEVSEEVEEMEEEPEQEPVEHEKEEHEKVVEEQPEEDAEEEHSVGSETMDIEATAYVAHCDTGCTGTTATGVDVSSGIYHEGKRVIAVSPDQIPLGSDVEVELNDGTVIEAVAEDTGGDIGYGRLDLLVESEEEAYRFGRQSVEVRIIE